MKNNKFLLCIVTVLFTVSLLLTGCSSAETAKRLRVAEEELHPAGKGAMLAFRK